MTIFGVSEQSRRVIAAIKEELKELVPNRERNFLEDFFELQKKEWLAQNVRSLNNLSFLAVETAEESLDNEDSFANLRKLQTMSFDQYLEHCETLMKDSQICSARLKGKDEK